MADTRLQMLEKIGSQRNPAENSEYQQLLQGGGDTGDGGYSSIVQQQLKLQQQANAPAVASLQQSIPEIQNKYAQTSAQLKAQQAPLEQRYQNLLNQITANQQKEEQRTSIAGARELGRRGISSESGFYDQFQNQQLSPVTQFYTGQAATTGQNREDAIRELQNLIAGVSTQETEQTRAVQNAIAQLMSGGNSQAIQNALGIYQNNQEQERLAQASEFQRQQAELDRAFQDKQYDFNVRQYEDSLKKANTGSGNITFNSTEPKPSAPPSSDVPSYFTQFNSPISTIDYSKLQSRVPTVQYSSKL